jgi:hypothetical protein
MRNEKGNSTFDVSSVEGFTATPNNILRDKRLHIREAGKSFNILCLIISFANMGDWDYTVSGLCALSGMGRDAMRRGLAYLEYIGYLWREERRRADGTERYIYHVYDSQEKRDAEMQAAGGNLTCKRAKGRDRQQENENNQSFSRSETGCGNQTLLTTPCNNNIVITNKDNKDDNPSPVLNPASNDTGEDKVVSLERTDRKEADLKDKKDKDAENGKNQPQQQVLGASSTPYVNKGNDTKGSTSDLQSPSADAGTQNNRHFTNHSKDDAPRPVLTTDMETRVVGDASVHRPDHTLNAKVVDACRAVDLSDDEARALLALMNASTNRRFNAERLAVSYKSCRDTGYSTADIAKAYLHYRDVRYPYDTSHVYQDGSVNTQYAMNLANWLDPNRGDGIVADLPIAQMLLRVKAQMS